MSTLISNKSSFSKSTLYFSLDISLFFKTCFSNNCLPRWLSVAAWYDLSLCVGEVGQTFKKEPRSYETTLAYFFGTKVNQMYPFSQSSIFKEFNTNKRFDFNKIHHQSFIRSFENAFWRYSTILVELRRGR